MEDSLNLDLKSEAQDFCCEHSFVPVCIAQAALERGAALATAEITKELAAMRMEMNKRRADIERGHPHGWASGSLEL